MIIIVLILMNTYFLKASRDMIFVSKEAFIENQAGIITTALSDLDSLTISSAGQVMDRLDVTSTSNIIITGTDGSPLYNSYSGELNGFITDNLTRALSGYDVKDSKFDSGVFLSSVFMPIFKDGAITGAVYVYESDPNQGAQLVNLQRTLKNISVLVALLSIAMIVFIIWTVMRRITGILTAIASVREGEYTYKIKISGHDELSALSDEFNSLTNRLRETDEVRRRFVADASHELKTPLASIRLLSDSILNNADMDSATVREFVSDIGQESVRLSRTTEKLMILTQLDSGVVAELTRVDFATVVSDTLRMLHPLAESRKISLHTALSGGCYILATEDSIHQIVFNLVENAIKYSLPGGAVTVTLYHDDEDAVLLVDDTGIGIPEQDMPHIFDRFYRVDKARSREAGGSGLGLSIVSDTVREFDGRIMASRREGGGMRFEVHFKIYAGNGN